jgi:acyl phosphate:glycerol-3-phosphate acyltransferase
MTLAREIRRKSFHVLAGMSIPVLYYLFLMWEHLANRPDTYTILAKWILVGATLAILAIDVIRLRHQFFKIVFIDFFGPLLRRHEISALTGATYLMLSSTICILIFRSEAAIAAISFMVVGDAFAAVIGRSLGRPVFFGKSFEGAAACLAGCLLVGTGIVLLPGSALRFLPMALGAVTATAAEMTPLQLDDNITIPILSGLVMDLLFTL